LENLFNAWTEFKKEKANKDDVAEFEINLEDHIFKLHEDLWSSRKNKGTHRAVNRLQKFGLELFRDYTRTLCVLKLDVRKFFDSVDHDILLKILQERTPDDQLIG